MTDIERWDYDGASLKQSDLPDAPLSVIRAWVEQAHARQHERGDVPEPDAISVATADASGQPHVRTVLMRYLEADGPGFYTNLGSRKGLDLAANPQISAALTWQAMFRAIRFTGRAELLGRDQVLSYFQSRPWGSRISAWASHQSSEVTQRETLEAAEAQYAAKFPDRGQPDDVPVPDFWGGYVIHCDEIELWAGRRSRLHDRLVYVRCGDGDLEDSGSWRIIRRAP